MANPCFYFDERVGNGMTQGAEPKCRREEDDASWDEKEYEDCVDCGALIDSENPEFSQWVEVPSPTNFAHHVCPECAAKRGSNSHG